VAAAAPRFVWAKAPEIGNTQRHPMNANLEPTRRRQWLATGSGLAAAGLFLLAAALQLRQIYGSRVVVPRDPAAWETRRIQSADLRSFKTFRLPSVIPDGWYGNASSNPPTLQCEIPYRRCGYTVNFYAKLNPRGPPNTLEVLINDRRLTDLQLPRSLPLAFARAESYFGREWNIPARELRRSGPNVFAIRNTGWLSWQGYLVLKPLGDWTQPLRFAVPLTGFLLLLIMAWRARAAPLRPFALTLIAVLLIVYGSTFYARLIAPTSGFFFSDCDEFVDPVTLSVPSYDCLKHILFFPVMNGLWTALHEWCGISKVESMALAFLFIALAANVTALLWFRRVTSSSREAALLTLAYSFAFGIWIYSSVYETYLFSALILNLLLLTLWPEQRRLRGPDIGAAVLLCTLAALAHPPLLLFSLLIPLRMGFSPLALRAKLAGWLLPAVIAAAFIAAHTWLFNLISDTPAAAASAADAPLAERLPLLRDILSKKGTLYQYARPAHLRIGDHLANVLYGQFIYAWGGLPAPFDYGQGTRGVRTYLRHATGWLFAAGWLAAWGLALGALLRRFRWLLVTLTYGTLIGIPYLLFFWFFNPAEMLLYAPPLMSLIAAWLAVGHRALLREHAAWFFAVWAAILAIHNIWVVSTYH
jgi:hypothetical protein